MAESNKPSILIIGGMGYCGRFLALHIHKNKLASDVRLVDKMLPELAWLAPEFSDACSRDKFVQADASREQALSRVFDRADGKEFDYVFNLGGETRYSHEDEVYKARSHALSLSLGREAARRKAKVYVEASTGMVYKPEKQKKRAETDKTKPWIKKAKWKLQAEEDLSKIPGLNLMIMRLAHVYGPYTTKLVGTALCMARVYQSLNKEMKWLWDKNLRTNTVHVEDTARALWAGAEWYVKEPRKGTPIFNVVDDGDTSQGVMARLIHENFRIPTGFQGTLISAFARLNLDHVVDDVNDEILDPWGKLVEAAHINKTTPLTPFMEKDLLRDMDLCMDGSAFKKASGFEYKHTTISSKELQDVVESYKKMGWWP